MDNRTDYAMAIECGTRVLGAMLGENRKYGAKDEIAVRAMAGFPFHYIGRVVSPNSEPWRVLRVERVGRDGKLELGPIKEGKKARRKARANAEVIDAGITRW